MAIFRINQFAGMAPLYDRRQLPVGAAQLAVNCRFDSGDLKAFWDFKTESGNLIGSSGAQIGNLFWFRDGDLSRFMGFGLDFDVTASRSPVPDDAHRRWYWCVSGEGIKAISLKEFDDPYPNGAAVGSGTAYRQFGGYQVGIPAPKEAPVATAIEDLNSVGFGTDVVIQTISRTNPITINTDGPHGFEAGQRVILSVDPELPNPADDEEGDDEDPTPPDPEDPPEDPEDPGQVGQIWALDGVEGVVSGVEGSSFDITGINATGFAEFAEEDIAALTVTRKLVDSDLESRAYVFTYVSEFDEEGPPSEPSNVVDVEKEGQVTLEISDLEHNFGDDGGSRDFIDRIRIYRTVAGTQATLYAFVGTLFYVGGEAEDGDVEWISEPSAANPALAWQAELKDSTESASLGESLQTEGWYPPPNELEGMLMMPNGIMAGWKGNTLYFSEPYLPHAWDPDYRVVLADDVVGCEAYGTTMVVGTRGRPVVVSGVDPSAMREERIQMHAPMLHRNAIVDAGGGVLYAGDNGLVWVGVGGARYLTASRYDKKSWLAAVENLTHAVYQDRRLYLFAPGQDALVLSLEGQEAEPSDLEIDISAATRRDNSLAMVTRQTAPGNPYRHVKFFNEADTRLTALWRSGIIKSSRPVNVGVAQVLADNYPVTIRIRYIRPGSYPEPIDGQPDLSVLDEAEYVVQGPEPFRLKGGYVSREFELEVEADDRVQEITVCSSMEELRQS